MSSLTATVAALPDASTRARAGGLDLVRGLRAGLARFPIAALELGMRVGVGMVFWKSAQTKLASWDVTVQLFADEYQVPLLSPELAALLGTATELAGAVLLFLGLGARLGAAALLGLTATIQLFVYPGNWPDHLLWASILTYVVTRGPGRLSLDHLVARRALRD